MPGGLYLLIVLLCCIPVLAQEESELEVIKARMAKVLVGSEADDALVETCLATLAEDGSWPEIDYEDISLTGYQHRLHLTNMEAMALAYGREDSRFHRSPALLESLARALGFWCDENFISANWWHNIIQVPHIFVGISLLMDGELPDELLDDMQPMIRRANRNDPWARPSGDRVKICGIEAKNYAFLGDAEAFADLIEILEAEIKLSTGKRGMQVDYSFHHRVHRVNNTTSYGAGYGNACAEWAHYVAGTRFALSEEKLELLVDFHLDGIRKQMVYGIIREKGVANRGITRKEGTESRVPPLPLEWLLSATDYRAAEVREIIALSAGEAERPTLSFCKYYWQTEHLAFQRPDFYASVRMYSRRNRNMELAHNSEGIFNHYKSDGANHLSVSGREYYNIWPAYDWRKIPGTTVLQKGAMPSVGEILKDGLTDFVGAATDGRYGVAGFDFISPHDDIRARKSWFFFDEEYVCLGAGIASNDFDHSVATTIDQRLLEGAVLVSSSAGRAGLERGERVVEGVSWVLHDGVGYLFPEPASVHISNETQTGSWYDINKQSSSSRELLEKEVFKLWIDHGKRPQGTNLWLTAGVMDTKDVTYAYVVVPSATELALERGRSVEILSNTSKLQAVEHTGLGIVQAVFYEAGALELASGRTIALDSPGIVMLKLDGSDIEEMTVSDPTRKLSKLHLSVTGCYGAHLTRSSSSR